MANRYYKKIYCTTDSKWEYEWEGTSTPLTVCPVDGGHSVVSGSGALVDVQDENFAKNNITTSNPSVNDDVDADYSMTSRWFNSSTNKEFVCLDNATGTAVWIETTKSGGSGGMNSNFSWANASEFYLKESNSDYAINAKIPGKASVSTPSKIKALVYVDSTEGGIKIYDVTNANTIAEKTGIVGGWQIVDLGTISNWPSSDADFEIQLKCESEIRVSAIWIEE